MLLIVVKEGNMCCSQLLWGGICLAHSCYGWNMYYSWLLIEGLCVAHSC